MPSSRHHVSPLLTPALLATALLAGCASIWPSAPPPPVRGTPPSAPAPSPAPFPATIEPAPAASAPAPGASAPAAAVLGAEYDWLQQLFGPTPVRLAMGSDGSITLRVPMQHSFDAGASQPKPALLAVLGKLGEAMYRQPEATLLAQVPGDAPRVSAVRDALAAKGISPDRVVGASAPPGAPEVLLQLVP